MTRIELVKELYRAFQEKDYQAFEQICAPDVEWVQNEGFPGGKRSYGARAIIENVFRAFDNSWESFAYEMEKIFDMDQAILVVGRYSGRHRATGKAFSAVAAHLYEIEDGKLIRYRQFADTKKIWDAMS